MNKRALLFPLRDDNPTNRTPYINWILIAINILVFIFSLANHDAIVQAFGFTPVEFSFLTIFTSMFLHASFQHIIGNMWFLFIFGDNIEDKLGHIQYLLFYLAAGILASLTHYITNVSSSIPAVGASGAISGVLGAYLVFYPHASVYVSGGLGHAGKVSAKLMLVVWFGYQFLNGVIGFFGAQSGVAFWAHIGGFVAGVAIAWLYLKLTKKSVKSNI